MGDKSVSVWSKEYGCCKECGTTERKHFGKGWCHHCRYRLDPEFRERTKERARAWYFDNADIVIARTEVNRRKRGKKWAAYRRKNDSRYREVFGATRNSKYQRTRRFKAYGQEFECLGGTVGHGSRRFVLAKNLFSGEPVEVPTRDVTWFGPKPTLYDEREAA